MIGGKSSVKLSMNMFLWLLMMCQFLTTALHGHISHADSYSCYTYFTGEDIEAVKG